jgi:hypothetical protein
MQQNLLKQNNSYKHNRKNENERKKVSTEMNSTQKNEHKLWKITLTKMNFGIEYKKNI